MSLKSSPITPHRPLYARSVSARRASPGNGCLISAHGSPSTSVQDSMGSPTIPLTPLDVNGLRATPKVWSGSKLESISESSANGTASEAQIMKHDKVAGGSRCYGETFKHSAVQMKSCMVDDPFTSSDIAVSSSQQTSSDSAEKDYLPGQSNDIIKDKNRPAREPLVTIDNVIITDDNAQALLHPGSCIFVANLPRDMPDAELYDQVKLAFMKHGYCFVKIRRNSTSNTPHAFVQYLTSEQAGKALALGRSEKIGGRSCRTEMAIAPRILFVSRKDNASFPEYMIRELLGRIGEIAEISEPTLNEQVFYCLAPGFFVKMSLYQAALSSISVFRHNPIWNVLPHHSVIPSRKATTSLVDSCVHPMVDKFALNPNVHASLNSLHECLWVGNIPLGSSFNAFTQLLVSIGPINQMETRVFMNPAPIKCFAWVWFAQPGLVGYAVQTLNGLRFINCVLQAQLVVRGPNSVPTCDSNALPAFGPAQAG